MSGLINMVAKGKCYSRANKKELLTERQPICPILLCLRQLIAQRDYQHVLLAEEMMRMKIIIISLCVGC